MEEEQRKKKLEAGKERLAAFRKKKIRKKPKRASDDDQSSLLGADGNLADASSNSDVQSLTGDSDQGSVSASDDWSAEESDLHSSVYYQAKLTDAVRRVAELEEIVAGKQLALDKVITENAELLQSAETSKTQADSENNLVDTCEAPQGGHLPVMNPTDVQTALAQRDIIIQQLTTRLRAAADKSSHDYTQEAQHLAQQVTLLQQQLQQAGETLRGQLNQHNSSAQALQEAKAEILALQVILKEKEDVLVNLNQQIALKDEENQTLHSQLVSHQAPDDVRFEIHGFEGQLKDKENLIIQLNQQLKQKDEEEKVLQNLLEEQQLKEKELQERLIHIEAKAKELESFVTQHEARTKELESYVEECTGREKEFVTCIEQHTKREQDLEVWVKQYASREQVYQESIKSFEAKLALFTKEKEVSLESLQLNGQDEKLSALMLELQNLESKNNEFETELNLLKQDKHELESRCCSVETQKCELEATVKELKDELESRNSETQTRYSELETESENEKQRLMSNLESKSVELEEFCKQIDEMQDEFASKQSENDELRNKINDQQGDIVTLKSQLEMLLQDEEQSGQEIDVLKELLETKEKVHAAELQEKDVLIVQLQTDLKSLQDEKSSYIATIENLSSQIVTFQTDLARSADECESFKVLAEKYKSELDEENDRHVSGEAASDDDDDDDDDDVDHADAFAVESELEVRRIETQSQKSISVQQYSADSVNVNAETKELLTKEASVSFLEDDIEKETMDNQNQTLPPSKVLGNSDEAQYLKIELEKLNGVCSSQSAKIFDLEGRISVLEKEVSSAHTQVEEIQGKLVEADHRNLILLSQQKEMTSEIQSLSSEVLNTTKLRESCLKCERLALCLSEETELRTQSLAKLQSAEKEVAMCRNSLDEKTEELEEEKDAKSKIQQQCVKFENELKMLMTERDALQKNECEKHSKEIQRLQTELKEVVEKHSQEIQLLQTELIEAKEHGEEVPRLRTKLAEAAATHSEYIQGLTSQLTEASAKHSDEIQQLQRELTDSKDYSVEVTKLKSELTATEKKNGDEIQTVQAQLKEMEDKLHDVNQSSETRLQSLHQECEQYKSETSLLQQDISEKMELLSTSEEQRSGLEARCSALSSEVECLKHEHSTLQDELDKSLLNLQEDQVKLDSMSMEISSLKEEANEAAAETSLLQCQYESVSSELHQYKENCNQQGQELTSLKQTLATKEEFGTERVELLEEIQKHQQQLTEVETSLSVQSSEVNDLKELLHSKQRELSETAAKLGEVMEGGKQTETELQRKCSDQVAEIGRLQFENEALLKNIENIKKEADSARSDLQTEIGMLQQELKKVKYEHEQVINEEVSLKSEMKVQLDASCSEIEQLQTKLQKTETELENVLHKFEDQKQDFDEQVNEMSAKLEEVKNGNKALKSEVEELTVKYHNEQDSRRASQDQYEHLLADIKKLENELETSREKMLTLDHLKQDLEERLFIEQTARDDVQSQYESLSSEFYKVNANDKKQSKDLFSHKQRLKDLLNVCFLEEDVPEVKSTDEYLSILEEYVSNSKIKFEELTATHHDLMDKFSGSEKTRSELSDRIEIMNVCETSLVTEIEDLKSQLKRTESELASLLPELKAMEAKANSVEEEKEILKANFDACIEDMQQKLSEQENQTRNLQSQLVESAKDSDQIATDVKMMYETHISDLEDKIVKMEGEVLQAKNSLSEQSDIKKSIDESYESKLVELELCVSSKEVEIVSLQDQLSKCRENFQLEKDELRNDFEIQITELEDSYRSMESGMMRLQTQMSEASKFHKQEKEETEKEFDIQISEVEDKCRSLEMDNGKLKRQMDEMAKDFCCEKEEMERIYERQILELEDKCSHSELKANQSRQHVNDISMDFGDEREAYEERIHALEINCVEIEKSRCDAEQRLRLVTEAAQEDKRVLQQNMSAELNELKKRHTVLETEHLALKEFLKQEEQSHKDHLETVTIQYENQVHELLNKCQVLSQQVRDHSTEREQLQTNDVDNQESLKVALESLKVSLAGLELEKKELQLLLEKERESAKESVQKWSTEKEELRLSLKGVQEDASEVHQRLSEIQEKHENEVKSYQQQIASLTDSAGVKVDEGLPKQVSKLNKELASSKEELSREKLKTRAAKKSVEKYKKELQKQKVNSQQEIDALKTRLEAWEVELIQRRRFVETAAPGTDLKLIHRHNLQKVEEAPEDDILEGMDPSAEEFMKAESKRLSSKEQCLGEFEPIQDSDFTDSFEPEPPTPEIMKIEPKFPLLVVTSSAHTQKGFQPEIQGEGFIQENDNSPTLYSGKTENTNIQVESHSSQSLDSVIHGDGFQPEIDIAKADTFQPELVTEFKQDDQLPSGLKPENEPDLCKLSSNRDQSKLADIPQKPSSEKEQSESSTEEAQLVKRQLQQEKDELEEQYVRKMKEQEVELQVKHKIGMETYQKEVDKKMRHEVATVKQEKHQAFIKALKKARKQLEEKHKQEVERMKQEMASSSESDLVQQLQRDNQDLAEARDALLQEISRNQKEVMRGQSTSSPKAEQHKNISDWIPSDKFLEELESVSRRSESEPPFEWELTMSQEEGVFDRELDNEGFCTRPECLELKQKYFRLSELYTQAQEQTTDVFLEEDELQRSQVSGFGARSRLHSDPGSEITNLTDPVNTSQDVSEGDYFEDSFKERIQKLEMENIALEKKLCDQLELLGMEKLQLEQKCESLQVNLTDTALSRQEVEERLMKQNEMLQSSLAQLKTGLKQTTDPQPEEPVRSYAEFGMVSLQTQTDLSGDVVSTSSHEHSVSSAVSDTLHQESSSAVGNESVDEAVNMLRNERTKARTELTFLGSEHEMSLSKISNIPSSSPQFLPSVDHMERIVFSDSPMSRRQIRGKRPQPVEISFNTTSVVSMQSTQGGVSVNKEQIEVTGTVSSAGNIVPEDYAKVALEIHHTEMVEEINRLKQELHDSKGTYATENAMLKEKVEREKIARQLWLEKKDPDENVLKELPLQTDVIELRKEVALFKENNKMLMRENQQLIDQVRDKECMMLQFRDKFGAEAITFEGSNDSDSQLLMLQKQRDELLEEIQDFHSEHERLLSVLDARTAMEEALRREKELLLEKLVQFEDSQAMVTHKHTELEFLRGEQRKMEQALLTKDESERQLLKQKRFLEEDMYEIEAKLREREAFLEEEKFRLMKEVKEKNLTILKLEKLTGSSEGASGGPGGPRVRRGSTGQLAKTAPLPGMDASYDEAIEILREKLKLQYDAKEADLNALHAGELTAIWQQQNKKVP